MNMWLIFLIAAGPGLYLSRRLGQHMEHSNWKDFSFRFVVLSVLIAGCLIMAHGIVRDALAQTLSPRYSGEIVDFNTTLTKPYAGYRGPATIPSYERVVRFSDETGADKTVVTFMKVSEEPIPGSSVQFYVLGDQAFEPSFGRYLSALLMLLALSGATFVFYILFAGSPPQRRQS